MTVGIKDLRRDAHFHASEAVAFHCLQAPRGLVAVNQNVGMVYQSLVARTNFNRPHPARLVYRNGQDEIPILICTARRQHVCLFRLENQVGLAQLPALHELRFRRKIGGLAFQHALGHPLPNGGDLFVCQAPLVGKFQFLRLGQPGRHEARLRYGHDLMAAFLDVLVRE